jgi:hypothetical protein
MNVKNFINDLLLEAALDSRVDSGIVSLHNCEHVEVLAEKMRDRGMKEPEIDSILAELVIKDGKYPDRQAFNGEGWLVTFPSKDYRDAAIKKGTHFIADPTHGKGGMNLYYKKKGKQKRQSQQDRTISEPGQDGRGGAPKPAPTTEPGGNLPPSDREAAATGPANSNAPESPGSKPDGGDDTGGSEELPPASPSGGGGGGGGGGVAKGGSGGVDAAAPVTTAPATPSVPIPPPYAELSIKFAQSKGWTPTPYGEWRDQTGEVRAVVGLTGEVVPIKQVERDEFKLFSEKNGA